MLVKQKVSVKINNWNINFYKNIGFEITCGDIIDVDIEKIHNKNLKLKVKVECDDCGNEREINLLSHTKSIEMRGKYICEKCVLEKIKKTNLDRYGVTRYNNREKCIRTNKEKYGVENVSQSEEIKDKKKETNLKNWGVENVFQSELIKDKMRETNLEKYGVEHPLQNAELLEKSKQTCLKNNGVKFPTKSKRILKIRNKNNMNKFGVEHYTQTDEYKMRVKETNFKKYGSEWYMSSDDFKGKSINTNLERYGVEYVMQNEDIFMKMQISGQKAKKHEETGLYYRGTYEKDFLDLCYRENICIEQGIRLHYKHENKNVYYFSDFYLREKNLVIEIKSKYYYNKYLDMNLAKMKCTKKLGYKFIFIIDKNYDKFMKIR